MRRQRHEHVRHGWRPLEAAPAAAAAPDQAAAPASTPAAAPGQEARQEAPGQAAVPAPAPRDRGETQAGQRPNQTRANTSGEWPRCRLPETTASGHRQRVHRRRSVSASGWPDSGRPETTASGHRQRVHRRRSVSASGWPDSGRPETTASGHRQRVHRCASADGWPDSGRPETASGHGQRASGRGAQPGAPTPPATPPSLTPGARAAARGPSTPGGKNEPDERRAAERPGPPEPPAGDLRLRKLSDPREQPEPAPVVSAGDSPRFDAAPALKNPKPVASDAADTQGADPPGMPHEATERWLRDAQPDAHADAIINRPRSAPGPTEPPATTAPDTAKAPTTAADPGEGAAGHVTDATKAPPPTPTGTRPPPPAGGQTAGGPKPPAGKASVPSGARGEQPAAPTPPATPTSRTPGARAAARRPSTPGGKNEPEERLRDAQPDALADAHEPMDPRHARGYAGEQGMGFGLYRKEEGWIFIEGPSGSAGHGVTTSSFDGVAYNTRTGELHLVDNKSLAATGNVSSAPAIDPTRNLAKNVDTLIARVEAVKDVPGRIRILGLLRRIEAALSVGKPLPEGVKLVVTSVGGRTTDVSTRLKAAGVEHHPPPPETVTLAPTAAPQAATAANRTTPAESAATVHSDPPASVGPGADDQAESKLLSVSADGTMRLQHPDGALQQRDPDGTNTFTSPGGSTFTLLPGGAVAASGGGPLRDTTDGGVEGTTSDGYTVTASHGNMTVTSPDGSRSGIARDGSSWVSGGQLLVESTQPESDRPAPVEQPSQRESRPDDNRVPGVLRRGARADAPGGKPRSGGLTRAEWAKLMQLRKDRGLPPRPTEGQKTIVGILIDKDGNEYPVESGEEPHGLRGTHEGGIPRGPGEGFSGGGPSEKNIGTHIEGHAAAIMHQKGLTEATLLSEKPPCKVCDISQGWDPETGGWTAEAAKKPGVAAINTVLPPGGKLTIVDPGATGTYHSYRLGPPAGTTAPPHPAALPRTKEATAEARATAAETKAARTIGSSAAEGATAETRVARARAASAETKTATPEARRPAMQGQGTVPTAQEPAVATGAPESVCAGRADSAAS